MSKPFHSRSNLIMSLFLVLITVSVYWQVGRLHFVSIDDPIYVTKKRPRKHRLDHEQCGMGIHYSSQRELAPPDLDFSYD